MGSIAIWSPRATCFHVSIAGIRLTQARKHPERLLVSTLVESLTERPRLAANAQASPWMVLPVASGRVDRRRQAGGSRWWMNLLPQRVPSVTRRARR